MSDSKSSWLVDRLNPHAHMRLFCLPYAGGGAAVYRSWQSGFPDGIEVCCVQLPGRESRFAEPPFTKMDPLVETLAEALVSALDCPFAFFGHSMGGLIAYELAKLLRHKYQMTPNHLFVSACHAPEIPDPIPHWHSLTDQQLMTELRTLMSFPREALEHAELMQIMLPKIRADSAVTETYIYRPAEPFHFPLTVFASEQDEMIPREAIEPWRNHTRAAFDLILVDGHHLFVQEQSQQIICAILGKLLGGT